MAAPALRLATEADFDPIAAITNHWIRTTAIHFAHQEVSAAELRAQWQDHAGIHPWLCATLDGAVVAYAKAGPWRARSAYRWTPETGIYVAPGHTGRGIGAPLYRRLLAVLGAQGFHSVVAGTTLPNEASVRLHRALGFVECGLVQQAGHKHGRWHDVQFWQFVLAPADRAPGELSPPAAGFAATG